MDGVGLGCRWSRRLGGAIAAIGVAACGSGPWNALAELEVPQLLPLATPISQLQAPAQGVLIQGEVMRVVPLLGSSLYEVQDSSGALMVLSGEPSPPVGATLRVRGDLHQEVITVGDRDWGADGSGRYLIETERWVMGAGRE